MRIYNIVRFAGLVSVVAGTGMLSAAPASAGGIGTIGSPAFDNTCVTVDHTNKAVAETVHASGLLNNTAQLPISDPHQSCGGAEDPVLKLLVAL
ncbi:hypothetical protein [Streptomyces sp. ICBB 8177]|uniref:hypothetical protein n=1 Tax=Streptomyces sp. ICBB 8177 TaxID=563922 RepID=UPI0011B53CE0|nr:hypothetical protein [Streptomyces sp. ICBB 8177]